jgi:hypothetical protein
MEGGASDGRDEAEGQIPTPPEASDVNYRAESDAVLEQNPNISATEENISEALPPAISPVEEQLSETQNTAASRLTVEQLLDYVKKQNAKVKKLKLENDEIRSQLESAAPQAHTTGDGFWREIGSRPEWQQRLAHGAVSYLLQSLQKPNESFNQLRRAFLHWHRLVAELDSIQVKKKLSEAFESQSQLEQRVSKLKTLLARMHQSNQKNVEDTVLARKNQLEIALEYQQRMTLEEAEKQALEEQLRCLAFESALHSDMELVIEKAAQQLASQVRLHPPRPFPSCLILLHRVQETRQNHLRL